MTLYHGSYMTVEKPDITFSRDNLDFGKGFYTTPIKEQAVSWANRFNHRHKSSVLSVYNINEPLLRKKVSILAFESYSDEWLTFVVSYRRGEIIKNDYDIIIGGVANDKVFDTIQLYFDGLLDKEASIKRLRYEKPNIQYCFKNQDTIDRYVTFISSEVLQ